MTVLRRLFPLLGSLVAVSLVACGEDAAAPAPVGAASGAGGTSAGSAGASAAGSAGTAAGGAKAGGAAGTTAGGAAGTTTGGAAGAKAGAAGSTTGGAGPGGSAGSAGGTAGTQSGGAGGQLPAGSCKVDADCPKTTETFPADCAEGYCGTDSKCRFRSKDDDGDGARKKTCQALGAAVVELGLDCNDADKDTRPGAWDGPADGPLPNKCGDGVDQDCSGVADDGVATTGATCTCIPGDNRACSTDASGNPITWPKLDATGNPVGECKRGSQTCTPQGKWGDCIGVKAPLLELCDKKDNDCDGQVDNGPPADAVYWRYDGDDDLHAAVGYAAVLSCDAPTVSPPECPAGKVCPGADASGDPLWRRSLPDDDCDDFDNSIRPGVGEVCNGDGKDHNCDGTSNDPNLGQCECKDDDIADCARDGVDYPTTAPSDDYPLSPGPALAGTCTWGKKECIAGKWGICTGGLGRPSVEENCTGDGKDYNCNGKTNLEAGECACSANETKLCGNCELGTSTCNAQGKWGACSYSGDPRTTYCEDKDADGVCGPCTENVCPAAAAGRILETACFKNASGVRVPDCNDTPGVGAALGAKAFGACRVCAPGAPSNSFSTVPAQGGGWDWNCDNKFEHEEALLTAITGKMKGTAAADSKLVEDYCASFSSASCPIGDRVFHTEGTTDPEDVCGEPVVIGECRSRDATGTVLPCQAMFLDPEPKAKCR